MLTIRGMCFSFPLSASLPSPLRILTPSSTTPNNNTDAHPQPRRAHGPTRLAPPRHRPHRAARHPQVVLPRRRPRAHVPRAVPRACQVGVGDWVGGGGDLSGCSGECFSLFSLLERDADGWMNAVRHPEREKVCEEAEAKTDEGKDAVDGLARYIHTRLHTACLLMYFLIISASPLRSEETCRLLTASCRGHLKSELLTPSTWVGYLVWRGDARQRGIQGSG